MLKKHSRRRYRSLAAAVVLALSLGLLAAKSPVQTQENQEPITVYLVRHAEKQEAIGTDTDVSLDAEGKARAEKLADLLSGCSISAAYTTPFKRTTQTAQAVVDKSDIEDSPVTVNPRDMASLLERIRASSGKSLLVVGHSNTIPAIVRALANREDAAPDIPETSYDNLFVVVVTRWEPREVTVRHLRFGKETPGGGPSRPEFTGCGNKSDN